MTRFALRAAVVGLSLAAGLAMPAVADAQAQRRPPAQAGQPAGVRHAVPRPPSQGVAGARYYSPYYLYRPYYYGGWGYPYYGYPSFGFGIGFGYGYGYGYAYPWYPYYGYPYYYGGYYGGSSIRLQVSPRQAEVYLDGYYAGVVDSFDGNFQRLNVYPGEHDLEIFMPGHRSYTQKIYVQPGSTFRVRHEMQPLAPGDPEPARPVVTTPASGIAAGPDRQPRTPQRPPPPDARDRDADRTPAAAEFGSLAIRVQPGDAVITIDGQRWEGPADRDRLVVQLGAGTHTVEIRKDGYRGYITDISVQPGETTTLNVSLTSQ